MRILRVVATLLLVALVGGCSTVVMSPSGDVAMRERNLIVASTVLMLLIIVPVLAATLVFAWRYRASNTTAPYDPDWHHSTQLEVLIWTAPLLIVVALGAMTWMGTHLLDPFRPIDRLDATRTLPASSKPLRIDVVALDWKWLFFYPDLGIATVNDVALPVDVPVDFHITSATVMNAFFIPALAGQIYAMAGMETRLSVVVNKPGEFNGLSSHYSGAGFSHMSFATHGLPQQGFDQWVAKVKSQGSALDMTTYDQLQKPSEDVAHLYYSSFKPGLFDAILNMCSTPGKMCQSEMMHIDAMGGGGKESQANRERLLDDSARSKGGSAPPGATFPASDRGPNSFTGEPNGAKPRDSMPSTTEPSMAPHDGDHHDMPGMPSSAPPQLNTH